MSYSRRQLYAAGEPLGPCATQRKPCGGYRCGGGGGDDTNEGAKTESTNVDKRNAVQDGVGVSGDSNTVVYNDPDAVKAIAQAGADVIKSSGGAVVELAKLQTTANADAWNKTVTEGAGLVDKLIDKVGEGFKLSSTVVEKFQPTENKNADVVKYAAIAAAVVGVAAFMGKAR